MLKNSAKFLVLLAVMIQCGCVTMVRTPITPVKEVLKRVPDASLAERQKLYDEFSLQVKDAEVSIGGGREDGLPIELGNYMSMCQCDRAADYQRGKDNTDNLIGIPLMIGASAALLYGGLSYLYTGGAPGLHIDTPGGAALGIGGAAALLSGLWVFHWGPAHQARNIRDFNECLRERLGLTQLEKK